jgi:hypothetical protein
MATTLKQLQDLIQKQILKSAKATVIKKSDVLDQIELVALGLTNSNIMFDGLNKEERGKARDILVESGGEYSKSYAKVVSGLNSKAAAIEKDEPLSIVARTCSALRMMLDDLQSTANSELPEKLNIFTAKYSHLAILGAVHVCSMFSQFSSYLMGGVVSEIIGSDLTIPEYRLKSVNDNAAFAIKLINDVAINTGPLAVNYVLKELRAANNDIPVVDQNDKPNTGFFNITKSSATGNDMIERGLGNPFFYLGSLYIKWKDGRIRRLEQEKEWMQANVALLRMRLDNHDKDDPQYQKLVKIIQNYSDQLAKIDRAIAKYYDTASSE